jgi:hypothetical protein
MSAMSELWIAVIDIVRTRGFWAAVAYMERYGYTNSEAITQVQGALKIRDETTVSSTPDNRQPTDFSAARREPPVPVGSDPGSRR